MKKAIKDKWLKALRGQAPEGEYNQGTQMLCSDSDSNGEDYFCCLGVLLNVTNRWKQNGNNSGTFSWENKEYFGLAADENHLIDMNDGSCGTKKHSFKQIAKWIEKNL